MLYQQSNRYAFLMMVDQQGKVELIAFQWESLTLSKSLKLIEI